MLIHARFVILLLVTLLNGLAELCTFPSDPECHPLKFQ